MPRRHLDTQHRRPKTVIIEKLKIRVLSLDRVATYLFVAKMPGAGAVQRARGTFQAATLRK